MTTTLRSIRSAPTYDGPIFDCDSHLYEVADSWTRHLPKAYAEDWTHAWKTGADGEYALYVGRQKVETSAGYFKADGRVPAPGRLHEWLRSMKAGGDGLDLHVPMTPDMYERDARLRKMDEFGVEACILYVGVMVSSISYLDDVDAAYAVVNAYNAWLQEDWGFAYKDRIFSTPILLLSDLDQAVAQAKWMVRNGARVVLSPMGPVNGRAPGDPYFDPVWAILNEAHVRVVYHISEAIYMQAHMAVWGERVQQSRLRQTAFVWMHGFSERPVVETLSSFIFWNFFDRFPNIRMMSAENGAEWVPAMLTKMDKVRGMAKNGHWPAGQLKRRPSEIFREKIKVVAYPEDDLRTLVDLAGSAEFFAMGSDYPHSEGVETPGDFITEACKGLDAAEVRQIMYDTGRDFIGRSTRG